MKKIVSYIILFVLIIVLFVGCSSEKNIKSYYIDDNNNLIVIYEDDSELNLGVWGEDIIESFDSISISSDDYYIINGIKTTIKTKVPFSYSINNNGHLIVTYRDKTNDDLGDLSESLVSGIKKISINENGYYVINGVLTSICAYNIYTVSFNTGYSKTVKSQNIRDGYKIEKPTLERTGYSFNGWYCNDEEWKFNSDVVKNNMTLTAEWIANEYTISFDNPKGTSPTQITAIYDSSLTLPSLTSVTGYTFAGWYYGDKKVESGKWTIASDVTLTAKWIANEYTVTLNPGVGSVSNTSLKVKFDETYTIPVPTNSYGTFNGWLYNGNLVTNSNGESLSNWNFDSNVTFTVDWIIHLSTIYDLQKLNQFKNAVFSLDNDIDISTTEWTPIGTESDPFTGTINGNSHKIKGMNITTYNNSIKNYGFIGTGNGLSINDLVLENVNIKLNNIMSDIHVGAIVGISRTQYKNKSDQASGIIINCSVNGTIEVKPHNTNYASYVGGISGRDSVVKNSTNNATIKGHLYASGIIGDSGKSINCVNNGIISGLYASGICYSGISTSCSNIGTITGTYSGGITIDGTAEQCLNTGNIIGVTLAGGIGARNAIVKYCVNEGSIQCDGYAGGILGFVAIECNPQENTCSNCCNRGDVTGATAYGIGGITATCCYNSGKVTATENSSYGIGSVNVQQSVSFGKVSATSSSKTYATSSCISPEYQNYYLVNCYYGQESANAYTKYGTETSLKYEKTLFVDLMYWEEYDSDTGSGYWNFNNTDYPTLWWE